MSDARNDIKPATCFVGSKNPFTGEPIAMKKPTQPKQYEATDASALSICDDPLPSTRALVGGNKYEAIFSALKHGQAIKCEPNQACCIANSLRKWTNQRGMKVLIRMTKRYPTDSKGRVWMLADPKAVKA